MAKKYIIGVLVLVLLTSSIYILLPDSVRIDVGKTYSTFKVWENDSWILAGQEYTLMFDGTKKMRASSRTVEHFVEGEIIKIVRIANFKNNVTVIDTYTFDGNEKDVKLFPISHQVNVLNGEGYILVYEVTKLDYSGETIKDILSPQEFGHNMRIEWESGNYYSRIWGYANRDEGKLTVKYRPDSINFTKKVRLFDPPGNNSIGYEFLDEGNVVHIWNTQDDYFFEKDAGIQLTNHYQDYWTKNIFCIGFYNSTGWNPIKCADELSNFNKQIESDNLTYVNATLWKDITYGTYDLRLGIQYHLGLNDENLSITIYGKNIGIDIPFDLGFAWKVIDIDVPSNETTNKIRINNTNYQLDGTYDLTFKDMKRYINVSFPTNQTTGNGTIIYNYSMVEVPIPFYKIHDISDDGLLSKENFLKIDWDENLDYAVKMYGNGNQGDLYVAILINAGHFNPGQEKSTTFYWIDALTDGLISYYKMDESSGNIIDVHGSNDGTNFGAAYGATGIINDALNFSVIDSDSVNITDLDQELETSGISFNFWIKPNQNFPGGTRYAFFDIREGGVNDQLKLLHHTDGNIYWLYRDSGGIFQTNFAATLNKGQWYMITTLYNSTHIILYINGTEKQKVLTTGSTGVDFTDSDDFQLGVDVGFSQYIDGVLDEFGVWNRALTSSEITDLYNSGSAFAYPLSVDSCTYSSGNWDVTCSDNCSITGNVNLGGNNLTLSNDNGKFIVEANISNFNKIFKYDLCEVRIYSSGGFN